MNNGNTTTNNNNYYDSNKGIAAKLLKIGEVNFSTDLDFLYTNRVVAVLEKAVERLQLLQLLDTAAPPETQEEPEKGATAVSGDGPSTSAAGHSSIAARGVETDGNNAAAATTTLSAFLASQMSSTARQRALAKETSTRAAASYNGSSPAISGAVTAALQETLKANQSASLARGRPTVSQLVQQQAELEARYGELLRGESYVRPPASEPQLDAKVFRSAGKGETTGGRQQELREVSERLRELNRQLCIQLKDNPNDRDNWAKINNERADLAELLRAAVGELTTGYQASMIPRAGTGAGGAGGEQLLGTTFSATAGGGMLLTRTGSSRSMLSQLQPTTAAAGEEFSATNYYDGNSSQAPTLRKRFGSTLQMRRGTRNAPTQPRIPLQSSFEKLSRTVLQEKAAFQWAEDMLRKEKELNLNVKQLRADLSRERQLKEEETNSRQQRLTLLHAQLRELQTRLAERERDFTSHAEAATEGYQRRALAQDQQVLHRTEVVDRQLGNESRSHELFAAHLTTRAAAAEKLAAEWEAKNSKDIKASEMQRLEAEQDRHGYAERLQQCEQDQAAHLEKQQQRQAFTEERAKAATEAEERKTREYEAASVLEAAIKAMLVRDALEKAGKKKKKKKPAAKK